MINKTHSAFHDVKVKNKTKSNQNFNMGSNESVAMRYSHYKKKTLTQKKLFGGAYP